MEVILKRFEIVYLHIGLPKTGTTAIQLACDVNRKILEKNHILYPAGYWHAQFGSCFSQNPKEYIWNQESGRFKKNLEDIQTEDTRYLQSLQEQFLQSKAKKLVISYEGFADLTVETLTRMHTYLSDLTDTIYIVMYCREPISCAISDISQRAKTGQLNNPYPEKPPMLSVQPFEKICRNFSHIFGLKNLLVRKFAKECFPRGDIRYDFFSLIGIKMETINNLNLSQNNVNLSLTREAIILGCELKNIHDEITPQDFHEKYALILESIKGHKYTLNNKQYQEIMHLAKPNLDYLSDQFQLSFDRKKTNDSDINNHDLINDFFSSLSEVIYELTTSYKGRILLCQPLTKLHTKQQIYLDVDIINDSSCLWKGTENNPIHLSYHWYSDFSERTIFNGERSVVPHEGINPGSSLRQTMQVVTPDKPGDYLLVLTLVKECLFWFEKHDEFQPYSVRVTVL